jgi:hypothetical protein
MVNTCTLQTSSAGKFHLSEISGLRTCRNFPFRTTVPDFLKIGYVHSINKDKRVLGTNPADEPITCGLPATQELFRFCRSERRSMLGRCALQAGATGGTLSNCWQFKGKC